MISNFGRLWTPANGLSTDTRSATPETCADFRCHCEERSDEAISGQQYNTLVARLLRSANEKQDGLGVRYGKNASPAKAGAHPSSAQQADKWLPAFAGKAIRWRFYQGRVGRPAGGQLAMTADPYRRTL